MKTVRKNRQVRKTKTRRHRMRSQKKVVGGVNWKFWEKSKPTDPAAPAPVSAESASASAPAPPAPEPVPQCPPCPVCDSTVHLPADQMPNQMPTAAAAQSGGRRRRSRKSRNATKKAWYQIGCKSF
jgi:hypothetical protein